MKIKQSKGSRLFDVANVTFMIFLMIIMLYPFYYVVCASFSNSTLLQASQGFLLAPVGFDVGAYILAFQHPLLPTAYLNTIKILLISLPINLMMTIFCAYFLAGEGIRWKKPITGLMLFTMFFSGGLVPTYLLIKNTLGLYDSIWALILPASLSLYNAIILKTAIEAVPASLSESAYIDGANDITILFKIIIPLILPTLAVIMLYYGVAHWNSWFPATIYLRDNDKLPLQAVLRSILILESDVFQATSGIESVDGTVSNYTESIKYAAIVLSTIPMLVIYPFVQKFFVKGVMIGAIKG